MKNNALQSPSVFKLLSLEGKTAFISGGAGLLGSEISFALAEAGAKVIIGSRNISNCRHRCEEINQKCGDNVATAIELDITDRKSISKAFKRFNNKNHLDILVNCSGFGKKNSFETITENDWFEDINISLNAPFLMIKEAFPHLKKTKGNILNIASMYGHIAPDYRMYDGKKYTNPPSYGAAKAGLLQLTRYLASFLSPHGIRVNSISPGAFPYESTQKENPEFIKKLSSKNTLGRIGFPHEIKTASLLLVSEASSYINGENICIDGGWTIW